jgi:hypothetical protein
MLNLNQQKGRMKLPMGETIIITFEYEGRQRNANVKEMEGDFERMFYVTMDNGYENAFFTTIDRPYQWYEQNIGYTEPAQAVGKAIEISLLS